MKTTRALSVYLIRDIAKFSGLSFKYHDRLTQAEAQQVAAWARSTPAIAAAYIDKGHPENGAVRLYAGMLEHYIMDHPQTGAAEPAPWPAATEERALPANAYGVTTAEEAEAFLAWAQTVPEYRAGFSDDKHPLHADYVKQTQELRELAAPSSPATIDVPPTAAPVAVANPGLPVSDKATMDIIASVAAGHAARSSGLSPAQIMERSRAMNDGTHLRARIDELRRNPAYMDGKHPGHAAAVQAVQAAYNAAYPEPAPIGALSSSQHPAGTGRGSGSAGEPFSGGTRLNGRIDELRRNPAYMDGKHPGHAAAVQAVQAAYSAAYPEPAPEASGTPSAA